MTLRDAWRTESANWIRFARTPDHDRYYFKFNLPSFLELLPPPRGLTIDVGCGEGRVGRELSALGYRIIGVDSSEPAVRALAAERPGGGLVGDAAKLGLRSNMADLVVAFMSLQDMDDPPAAIAEIARVLGPGGRFCFALLHPFISAGDFTADKHRFVIDESYWADRRHTYYSDRDGVELTFWQKHHPLSLYTGALEAAGLLIESLREPRPDEDAATELGSTRLMPVFLHGRAVKP